ncbi:MAG: DNA polymerase III subunit alpha [Bacteroidales bacterium]|nr:DNA polymerase III subunit alpha [Bacteroidales bacterium]
MSFTHLHVHTQYSILDGASNIPVIIKKAVDDDMPAVCITDHGNMFGVKEFHNEARKQGIKPIIGCEIYIAKKSRHEKSEKAGERGSYHLILIAKNEVGYKNLLKLVSLAWTEGFYYNPRIDKELLRQYHEGIIASSACLGGEIPQALLNNGPEEAEKILNEYTEIFGEDFYLELHKHPSGDAKIDSEVLQNQLKVNEQLIELSKKTGVKLIVANDVHFVNAEDAEAHDRLICLNTGKDLDDPDRMRYTKQEYFKTQAEMAELFAEIPEALENTQEIVDKVEEYMLNRDPVMPYFPLPEGFDDEDEYLKHLTYLGAEKRYDDITDELKERIDFELSVIKKMGYPGYFLIVQDFLNKAREMKVSVGPGRGSAAGSVVAYCLRITEIDPIRYNLLFERFLNPDRISMPDIDIDFDEDGREKVLEYVVDKYGYDRVAQIITFGTMAAKMAIRDVARVQKLPLPDADRLAKLVPERPGISLKQAYDEVKELSDARKSENELIAQTLKYAETLEGSVRHTGIHACGIIIGRDPLMEYIPVCTSKDTNLLVTQFEGSHVESVGMLKMDFLGLKTLSIILDALANIKATHNINIDIDNIPLDDIKTYELYSQGETTGLFQFESAGMKKYLKELKPNRFDDLIAMNALYRPGPMDYIPSFINRKSGREKIIYDTPEMEEYLQDTYGITVYQEQVMLLSQKLAGFTKGMADSLRKGMGKKNKKIIDELKPKFIEGCKENKIAEQTAEKIWKDWEAFASYAFNKSHSTCYAYVSYQTAYLKAHYPAEFMAAVLSRNITDIKKITVFMDECKRMGIQVLCPDVNESDLKFTVNKEGNIRFGLGAIKGVGEAAVLKIIDERKTNGSFHDIFSFVERVDLRSVNKKSLEALAMAGAFDSFAEMRRHQYFLSNNGGTFIEDLLSYGNKVQAGQNSAMTLFGENSDYDNAIEKPKIPTGEEWGKLTLLNKEKELIGMYLSAHPLDDYRFELDSLRITPLVELQDLQSLKGKDITIAGIVTESAERMTKTGKPFGTMTIEDYTDTFRIVMFSKDYLEFKKFFTKDYSLLLKGKVQENPWKKENPELELKIQSINMLSAVKDDMIKSISLEIPLNGISENLIEEVTNITETKNGSVMLKFIITDREDNMRVELFSRNQKIKLEDKFINYLRSHQEIEYKVN